MVDEGDEGGGDEDDDGVAEVDEGSGRGGAVVSVLMSL